MANPGVRDEDPTDVHSVVLPKDETTGGGWVMTTPPPIFQKGDFQTFTVSS
jgi:hypothetical protein